MKINLNPQYVERITLRSKEKYFLKSIRLITIKKTLRENIREIKITFASGYNLYLDGLQNFENFKQQLLIYCGKDIKVKQPKEYIDYDHPIFYVVLGLLTGFITISALKIVSNLNSVSIRIIYSLMFIYVFPLGGYFILSKPLAKRYGNKTQTADYIFGLFFICIGTAVYLLVLNT